MTRTDNALPVRLADYRAPDHLIDRVELDFRLTRHETIVRSKLSIRPNPMGVAGAPLRLDGDELKPLAVFLDGVELDLRAGFATQAALTIEAPPQRPFTLEIACWLDPATNTKLMGLYRSGSAYCTQCEADGFRRITYFLDRPDILSLYHVRLEAEQAEAPVLLSNGNLVAAGVVAGTSRHFAEWSDPHPKPCYLFALVAGDLGAIHDQFVTMSGRQVALAIYVEHGKEERARYAMDALKRSMRWDETAFGREYDLDVFNIVAVSDFNMGAMENKGLNIFNDKLVLASPETATDEDYLRIEAVIAHEYFHNWTGNRITCRDWFQLCLKEGLTVFRDQEFTSEARSRAVKRIADVRLLRATQFQEDSGPLAHNVRPELYYEINNFYTATVYEKGAELIRMLKRLIGDVAFAAGMNLYFARCDGKAVTMEDFLACFAEISGRDLGHFQKWYSQAGTPVLKVTTDFNPGARTFTLDLSQSCPPTPGQPTKEPLLIPVALALIGGDGAELALEASGVDGASAFECQHGVFELAAASRRIVFRGVAQRPALSILRGFSAPVRLESDSSEAELRQLAIHDSDPFCRWQAAQTLAMEWMKTVTLNTASPPSGTALIAVIADVLAQAEGDPAFAAQMLALPNEADVAREIAVNIDPDAIHSARERLLLVVSRTLGGPLAALYDKMHDHTPYSPNAAAAGRRAIRNAALAILCAGDAPDGLQLAQRQFDDAPNMTDEIAALTCLARGPAELREAALARFHERHAGDPLVLDKWFTVQAALTHIGALDRVRELTRHPAFSFANPNRVRALIGGFANNQTPVRFHARDGSGYEFLASSVISLDKTNPQIAARLLGALRNWRTLEPARREAAHAQLERVSSVATLSPDVRDIVTRALA